MKISTFYHIYYKHRFAKSGVLLRFYLLLVFPIRFIIYIIFLKKKINLDYLAVNSPILFNQNLSYLFEYFNRYLICFSSCVITSCSLCHIVEYKFLFEIFNK